MNSQGILLHKLAQTWLGSPCVSSLDALLDDLAEDLTLWQTQPPPQLAVAQFAVSLLWLGLLGGTHPDTLQIALRSLPLIDRRWLRELELEQARMLALYHWRDGQNGYGAHSDIQRMLPSFPGQDEVLRSLYSLRNLGERSEHNLVVDLTTSEIRIRMDGELRSKYSETLTSLLWSVSSSGGVSVRDAVVLCYSASEYDPLAHDQKLATLLYNGNRFLRPYLTLRRRYGHIICDMGDMNMHFRGIGAHTQQVRRRGDRYWRILHGVETRVESRKVAMGKKIIGPSDGDTMQHKSSSESLLHNFGWWQRLDVEREFGWSRATATRRLEAWVAKGVVAKQGIGKATRYMLTNSKLRLGEIR
jgi:hypothetical protein